MFAFAPVLLVQVGMIFVENRWVFTVQGIVIAAALWIVRYKDYGLSPILLLGCPILGLYTTIFLGSRVDRCAYSTVGLGILVMLDGAIALIRYIVRKPAAKVPEA